MTSPVIGVPEDMHIVDLFLIFSEKRINHLPVVDDENRLTGIVTRLDLLSPWSETTRKKPDPAPQAPAWGS